MDDTAWDTVDRLVEWIDTNSTLPPETDKLLRIMKLAEEVGEVNQAVIGVTGQNVYLYCASAGLATVFRESVPAALAKTLQLAPGQVIQFAQTIGYPKT